MTGDAAIREAAARIAAAGDSRPRAARDPVNLPMICKLARGAQRRRPEVPGPGRPGALDRSAALGGLTAPSAMIQVWTMPGLHGHRAGVRLDQVRIRQVRGTSVNQVPGDGPVLVTAGTGVPTSGLILSLPGT